MFGQLVTNSYVLLLIMTSHITKQHAHTSIYIYLFIIDIVHIVYVV